MTHNGTIRKKPEREEGGCRRSHHSNVGSLHAGSLMFISTKRSLKQTAEKWKCENSKYFNFNGRFYHHLNMSYMGDCCFRSAAPAKRRCWARWRCPVAVQLTAHSLGDWSDKFPDRWHPAVPLELRSNKVGAIIKRGSALAMCQLRVTHLTYQSVRAALPWLCSRSIADWRRWKVICGNIVQLGWWLWAGTATHTHTHAFYTCSRYICIISMKFNAPKSSRWTGSNVPVGSFA